LLSFVTPLWLLGLALLPVMRWLHRGGRHRRAVPVSRLSLWHAAAASSPAAGERRPPDPAWRRRALLTALVLGTLAEPQLPATRPPVTLWIDDSPSMRTREATGTRLAQGVAQARSLLGELGRVDLEVRKLGDPWHALGALSDTLPAQLGGGADAASGSVQAPPEALLRRDGLHWLVTDGAHAELLEWPGGRSPDRVLRVGSVTRNVGLERLSARRNPVDAQHIDLLLKLTNGGTEAQTRTLVLATEAGEGARSTQRLAAGGSVFVTATVPASSRVHATLQPGDALAEDDTIALDLAPLRRRGVAIDPKCPAALRAAVSAHPGLALAAPGAGDAQAVLDCGTRAAVPRLPLLRVLAEHAPSPSRGPLQWAAAVPASQRLALDAQRLVLAAALKTSPGDAVLLALGDAPVVVARAGAVPTIETSLDLAAMGAAGAVEVPLLVNWMFERLIGQPLLDPIALADRGAGAARVAPAATAAASASDTNDARPRAAPGLPRDLAPPLLIAAMLVLAWEIVALARQWVRLRPRPGEGGP
jgi:hypothetical protein